MNRGELSDLVFRSTLSGPQRLAILAHASHLDSSRPVEQGRAWPGPSRMARCCGCSLSGAKKVRRELKALGILVEAGFEGAAKAYRIDPTAIPVAAVPSTRAQASADVTRSPGHPVTTSPGHEVTGARGDRPVGHEVTGAGHEVPRDGSRGDPEPSSRTLHKTPLQEPSTEGAAAAAAPAGLPPLGRGVRPRDLTGSVAVVLRAWFGPDAAAWAGRRVRADQLKCIRAALREYTEGDLLAVVEFHRGADHRDAQWARDRGLDLPNLLNARTRHRNVERALRWRRGLLTAPPSAQAQGAPLRRRSALDGVLDDLEVGSTDETTHSNVIALGAR